MEQQASLFLIKKIANKSYLKKLLKSYDKLTVSAENHNVDRRITMFLHQKNGVVDTLCLGENFGVVKNGILMNDSIEFLNLVKTGIGY